MMDFPSHEQGHSHSHAHIIIPIKEPVHLTHDGMSYYLMPATCHSYCLTPITPSAASVTRTTL